MNVKSSFIKSVDYDQATRRLTVEFLRGQRYVYDDVSPGEYEALLTAESVGRHFQQFIKDKPCQQA